jgi:hypothetical protein
VSNMSTANLDDIQALPPPKRKRTKLVLTPGSANPLPSTSSMDRPPRLFHSSPLHKQVIEIEDTPNDTLDGTTHMTKLIRNVGRRRRSGDTGGRVTDDD